MIICLGGFHWAKNFLGVIGRRMEESGKEQILEELFGPSQISSILKGSKYNRGIATHKSLVEMLLRRKWKSFREWAEQKNDNLLNELIGDIDYQIKNFTSLLLIITTWKKIINYVFSLRPYLLACPGSMYTGYSLVNSDQG